MIVVELWRFIQLYTITLHLKILVSSLMVSPWRSNLTALQSSQHETVGAAGCSTCSFCHSCGRSTRPRARGCWIWSWSGAYLLQQCWQLGLWWGWGSGVGVGYWIKIRYRCTTKTTCLKSILRMMRKSCGFLMPNFWDWRCQEQLSMPSAARC